MKFELQKAIEILRQTPYVLTRLLEELSPEWTASSGDETNWGAYDVIGHLIHGEEADWIVRAEIILSQDGDRQFTPFDRTAQFSRPSDSPIVDLLSEFAHLRNHNLEKLIGWQLTEKELKLTGIHPEFGEVTLEQLLATWVVHDLNHIRQIVTHMAAQYEGVVGPWKEYLSILR